ncbi:MAG TPA: alpha/beta hydrolase [Solirubrobacterales bacterium]
MTDNTYWRSPDLGTPRDLDLPAGKLRCFEAGDPSAPTIVFVHGLLVNANLWRKVVPRLSDRFHCVSLDMPLGSHELALPKADLSPTGLADLITAALEALDVSDVTLVGNDTGGGLCQIAITRNQERVGRLFLTSCDAFENFPPKFFDYLKWSAKVPGAFRFGFAPLRLEAPRQLPLAFGWLVHRKIDREATDSYVLPTITARGPRDDVRRVLPQIEPSYLLDAAAKFGEFRKPVLIAWSEDDKFFPPAHADRLAAAFPDARVEWIADARTLSSEDQPERVAALVGEFAEAPAAVS